MKFEFGYMQVIVLKATKHGKVTRIMYTKLLGPTEQNKSWRVKPATES